MSRRFSEEVVRLREQLEVSRSEAEIERGLRRLHTGRPKPRRAWLLIPAVAILILIFFLRPNDELVILAGAECVARSGDAISAGPCGVELSIGPDANDLAFDGRARFSVKKRNKRPFSIAVSHGRIIVIGTRFLVEQRRDRGRIDVEDGTVEFRWSDGSPSDRLNAGDSLE